MTVVSMKKTSSHCSSCTIDDCTDIAFRYGAVVRSNGAYVPPGARKGPLSPPASAGISKVDIPKVAINAPDGAPVPDKDATPAPSANKVSSCRALQANLIDRSSVASC